MKKIFCTALLFLITNNLFSQSKHELGFSASSISGAGLSYKYSINDRFETQATYGSYFWKDESEKIFFQNTGLEIQINFHKNKNLRLFGLVGGAYWYLSEKDIYYNELNQKITKTKTSEAFSTGSGFGIEFLIDEKLTLKGNIGYGYYQQISDDDFLIRIAGGIGFAYKL